MKKLVEIPTARQLFAARLDELRAKGASVSSRNLAELLNLSIGKDVIIAILNGDTGRRPESYGILARGLEMDEYKVEAALAWQAMSEPARAALFDMVRALGATSGPSRLRLEECLRWMGPQTRVMADPHGFTQVINGGLHLLFIYADELSVEEVATLAGEPVPVDLLEKTRIIFLVVPEGWTEDQERPYYEKLPAFRSFTKAVSIEAAQKEQNKQIIFGKDRQVLDWIFRHRFDPTAYLESKAAKDRGTLFATPLAPLQVSVDGAVSEPAQDALLAWCRQPPDKVNMLTLEGAYGTGKSTVLETLERELVATAASTAKSLEYIPIRVQARTWIVGDKARLFEWLRTEVFAACNFGKVAFDPDLPREVFEALCAGTPRFILLVDGLDEAVRSAETLDAAMSALRWFASLGNRVIVATRPEVFIDKNEVKRELTQPGVTRAALQPIQPEEVDKYIEGQLGGEALRQVQQLRQRQPVRETLERPIFLQHICRLAHDEPGRLEKLTGDEPFELFELLTDEWLDRERFRTAIFRKPHAMQEFLQEMAIELSGRQQGRVFDDEMTIAVQASLDDVTRTLRGQDPTGTFIAGEDVVREARVCSFVTVDETEEQRQYSFNLRPFKSYFLAEAVVDELGKKAWKPERSKIGRMRFEVEDLQFIASGLRKFADDRDTINQRLVEAIRFTASSPAGRLWPYAFLGGNAAAIYAAINGNRLELDLTGVSLAGLMLRETQVVGTWRAVDLSEAMLSECDLDSLTGNDIYAVGAFISGVSDGWGKFLNVAVPDGLIALPSGEVERHWADIPEPAGYAPIAPGLLEFAAASASTGAALMHGFFVKKTSVTNHEFRSFLKNHPAWGPDNREAIECVQRELRELGTNLGSDLHYLHGFDEASHGTPVVYLPRPAMAAFCRGSGSRLPSEAEWEHAFAATHGDAEPLTLPHDARALEVDRLPRPRNGVVGMQAQVREMCADCYWRLDDGLKLLPTLGARIHPFFRPAKIHPKNLRAIGRVSPANGVVRGTSFALGQDPPRASRERYPLGNMDRDVGFRPVIDIAPGLALALGLAVKAEPSAGPASSPASGHALPPGAQSAPSIQPATPTLGEGATETEIPHAD